MKMKKLQYFVLIFLSLYIGLILVACSPISTNSYNTNTNIHSKYPDECKQSYDCISPDRQECKWVENAKRYQCVYTEEYQTYRQLLDQDSDCQSECMRKEANNELSKKATNICIDDCAKTYDWRKYKGKY